MQENESSEEIKTESQTTIKTPETKEAIKAHSLPFVWLYAALVAGIMWIVTKNFMFWPFYFILGTATSLFNFTTLLRYVNRTKPEALKKGMFLNYSFRLIMYGIVLGFAFLKDGAMAIIPTGIGFLSVKIVLVVYTLIKRGEKI